MSDQLFLALQTPVVEIPVTGTDPTGKTTTIKVGFIRHDIDSGQDVFDEIAEVNQPLDTLKELMEDGVEVSREQRKAANEEVREKLDDILRREILYFKDVQLYSQVSGKMGEYKKSLLVADTRLEKELKELEGKNSLDFLLEMHLSSALWRTALIEAMVKAISNIKLGKEAETKN